MDKDYNLQADGERIISMDRGEEELAVPAEVQDLFDQLAAARNCRDRSIAAVFSARRALWFEKQAIQAAQKAWTLVYKLWPQVRGNASWTYYPAEGVLRRTPNAKG